MHINCTGCFWVGRCKIVFDSSVCISARKEGEDLSISVSGIVDRLNAVMDDLNSSAADDVIKDLQQLSNKMLLKE